VTSDPIGSPESSFVAGADLERGFSDGVTRFFGARLRGPAEARSAVLAALEAGAPYPLARIASAVGPALGIARDAAHRLALLTEVVQAALSVCVAAYQQSPLPGRLDRAMRVLVADTLLTFAWEVAADLPEPGGDEVRLRLAEALGPQGFLGALTSCDGPRADPERAASVFLGAALLELVSAGAADPRLDPGIAFEIRLAASLAERGPSGAVLPDGTIPPRLDTALAMWRAFAARRAGRPE
jgi:hypothetical protein